MAMAHWGVALALGPNINLDVDPDHEKQAYDAVQSAMAHATSAPAKERDMIAALAKRYSNDPKANLKKLAVDPMPMTTAEMDKFVAFSGAGCVIRAAEVPVAKGATVEEALTSGEEAELVCVGPEELIRGTGLQPFGFLTDDPSVQVLGASGLPLQLEATGYDHFA
jgi:hypothetical protein